MSDFEDALNGLDVTEEEGELTPDFEYEDVFSDKDARESLSLYLQQELQDIREGEERAKLERDWAEWRRQSLARPEHEVRNEPWPNSSNVATPFMFSNINGVTAHVKSALVEKKPRFTGTTLNEKYKRHGRIAQDFVNRLAESPQHMNLPSHDDEIIYDLVRFGTRIVEVPWEERRQQFKRVTADGTVEIVDRTVYQGPGVCTYRLEDVFIRSDWDDVQRAPYIMLRKYYTRSDMDQLAYNGFFQNVEDVLATGGSATDYDENREREKALIGVDPDNEDRTGLSEEFEVIKAYVRYDGDEDGMPEDLIVWFEPESMTFLRTEYNDLGARPVVDLRHIKIPGLFYGVGVGWMLSPLQEEIDTLHNMRINGTHVHSLQMFVTNHEANIGPDEPMFPMKAIPVDDPSSFRPIVFPDVSNATMMAERMAQEYGRTVTGISEVQLGMPDSTAKSGTTPTLQKFLEDKGNEILRSIIRNAEIGYGLIAQYALLQCVANSDRVLADGRLLSLVPEEDMEALIEVLEMDVEEVYETFQFSVRSTAADETEDAKRQMILQKMQMYTMYIQQSMGLQQMVANPQAPPEFKEMVQRLLVGLTDLMSESLSLMDTEEPEKLLPNMKMQRIMLELMDQMRKPQLEQLTEQLEAMKDGNTQRLGQESGGYTPGYTADERTQREPGVGGPARMAQDTGGQQPRRGQVGQGPGGGPTGNRQV